MLDQTFSAENFRRIYDIENRRGRNVDHQFFPNLVEASARITAASAAIRTARKVNSAASADKLAEILQPLKERLRIEREAREDLVEAEMESVAHSVLSGYQIQLEARNGPNNQRLFTLPSDPKAYFVGKQIQRNIGRLYKVKSANRRAIIRQVFDALDSSFKYFCIRSDVKAFFDSIDRQTLIKDLDRDQLLSHGSKKHIKQALSSYGKLANKPIGIPRGLGISAFLSELYMRSIDEKIRQLQGVVFYARYVDDIIIIFAPTAGDETSTYLKEVSSIFLEKNLTLNTAKTQTGATGPDASFHFEYLGYRFSVSGGRCEVTIGHRKLARYRKRLDRAFEAYERQAALDQKGAARLLAARVKFMTSNTRLINNKRHAYTGIYFNNSSLTRQGQLAGLDAYLAHRISLLDSPALQDRLDTYSFVRGFKERRFVRYNTRTLARIVEAWRYEG